MNWLFVFLSVLMLGFSTYILVRVKVVALAKKRKLFTSPNIGRIQARVRGGNIIAYMANLKGLSVLVKVTPATVPETFVKKFLDIDEETGEVLKVDKPARRGIWWSMFGVRWIGLDSIQDYDLEVTRVESDGSVKTEIVKAHSLHYSGIYPVVLEDIETLEGPAVSMQLMITTATHHAGHCLKYKSKWLEKLISAVKAALRDFVGKNKTRDLLEMQNEKPDPAKPGLVDFIRSLNVGTVGNTGLIETLGQEIVDVNLESIKIDPEVAEALKRKQLATENAAGEIETATKKVLIAEQDKLALIKKAEGEAIEIQKKGDARNAVLKGECEAVSGKGSANVVGLAKWNAVGELKDLKGTLVFSDGEGKTPSVILPNGGAK